MLRGAHIAGNDNHGDQEPLRPVAEGARVRADWDPQRVLEVAYMALTLSTSTRALASPASEPHSYTTDIRTAFIGRIPSPASGEGRGYLEAYHAHHIEVYRKILSLTFKITNYSVEKRRSPRALTSAKQEEAIDRVRGICANNHLISKCDARDAPESSLLSSSLAVTKAPDMETSPGLKIKAF